MGPGGHLRRDHRVGGPQGQGQNRQQLPGHGAVATQPDQPRGPQPGAVPVAGRHRRTVPRGHGAAAVRPVSEGRAGGEPARGGDLQHGREPVGPAGRLAAGVRARLRIGADAALPPGGRRAGVRQGRGGRRQLRVRPRQAGAASATAGEFRRRALGRLAGERSAPRRRAARRDDLSRARADRGGARVGRAGRRDLRGDDGHRRRFRRQGDRRVPGGERDRSEDGRVSASDQPRHLPRSLP